MWRPEARLLTQFERTGMAPAPTGAASGVRRRRSLTTGAERERRRLRLATSKARAAPSPLTRYVLVYSYLLGMLILGVRRRLTSVVGPHSLIVADAEGVQDGGDVDIPEHAAAAPAAATPAREHTHTLYITHNTTRAQRAGAGFSKHNAGRRGGWRAA